MFRPSERQKQIRAELDSSWRGAIGWIGESRLIWLFGVIVLLSMNELVRDEPLLIFLPLPIFAVAIYKHYFPTESLHTESRDAEQEPERDQPDADEVPEGPLGELRATEKRMLETMASLQAGGPALASMAHKFAKTRRRLLHRKPRTRTNRKRE